MKNSNSLLHRILSVEKFVSTEIVSHVYPKFSHEIMHERNPGKDNRLEIINNAIRFREDAVKEINKEDHIRTNNYKLFKNMLLVRPDFSLSEGWAEEQSNYFFDVYNLPPWWSWIGFAIENITDLTYRGSIISYIPQKFHADAKKGVSVAHDNSLVWFSFKYIKY